jgi:hypothetical protein
MIDASASFAVESANVLLAAGVWTDGPDSWSGMGVAAYAPDGRRVWHVLQGEAVAWLQTAGAYAYVSGPDAYPATTRVIDLGTGAVGNAQRAVPVLVTQ